MAVTTTNLQRNRCIFCGGTGATKEHIVSDWINDVLPGPFEVVKQSGDGSVRSWSLRKLDLTAKVVCKRCNETWMSDIVGQARPVVATDPW
jgi:hypothetical protein